MQQIISASRRTDIPAFYGEWFLNRLGAGYCEVLHPYTKQWSRVSLRKEDVGAIVFWSKNYAPLLPRLGEIERTTSNLFFHFTITGNRDLELRVPAVLDAVRDYRYLADRYSPEHIVWRFDPVCLTDRMPFAAYDERFCSIAEELQGHASACIISFAHPYRKMLNSLKRYSEHTPVATTLEEQRAYADRLAERAAGYGIRLLACCNDHLLSERVGKARCIDGRSLSLLFGAPLETRAAASRKECGCTRSVDIGAYDTCGHGCLYCYATRDQDKARQIPALIEPDSPALAPKHLVRR